MLSVVREAHPTELGHVSRETPSSTHIAICVLDGVLQSPARDQAVTLSSNRYPQYRHTWASCLMSSAQSGQRFRP